MSNSIGQVTAPVPAGWYPDAEGNQRWWDGKQWTDHVVATAHPVPAAQHTRGPMTAGSLNVKREVIYNRQQKGHSLVMHLLFGVLILWANVVYISVSPNHYWHT